MSDQPLSEDNNQASYGTNANAPAGPAAPAASRKMQATKAQVDEVVDIMRSNVEAVLERDAKISMMETIGRMHYIRARRSLKRRPPS